VGKPGKYELRADTTVMEAVEIAAALLTRQNTPGSSVPARQRHLVEARVFNLKKMLKEKRLSEVSLLRPGDLVFIPQNSVSKIERFLSRPSLSMYLSSSQF